MALIGISMVLMIIISALVVFALYQVKLAGMDVQSFYEFILANARLQKLYEFVQTYEKTSLKDQMLFLDEAKAVFDAYEKVPTGLWEEDYNKYIRVLERYQKIRNNSWKNKPMSEREFKELIEEVNKMSGIDFNKHRINIRNRNNPKNLKLKPELVRKEIGHINIKYLMKIAMILLIVITLNVIKKIIGQI